MHSNTVPRRLTVNRPFIFPDIFHREQDKFLVSLGRDDKFLDALAETTETSGSTTFDPCFLLGLIVNRAFNNNIIIIKNRVLKIVDKSLLQ